MRRAALLACVAMLLLTGAAWGKRNPAPGGVRDFSDEAVFIGKRRA